MIQQSIEKMVKIFFKYMKKCSNSEMQIKQHRDTVLIHHIGKISKSMIRSVGCGKQAFSHITGGNPNCREN